MKDPRTTCESIQSAATEEEVVGAVRDYLASLSAAELALMPPGLTALGKNQAQELVDSALQLVHHEIRAALDAPGAELIKDAALVFSTAASRLAALAAFRVIGPSDGEGRGDAGKPGVEP